MVTGPGYGERPEDLSRLTDYIKERDRPLIESISEMPTCVDLLKNGKDTSMCGLGAAMLSIELARNIGKTKGKLLKYAVGSEICDRGILDQTGFASFTFL